MTAIEAIILNFEEIRGRSIKIWSALTPQFYHWKPDEKAQSGIEMIRHVLEVENLYRLLIINKGGNVSDFISPWKGRPLTDLQNDLEFAAPYRKEFLKTIKSFTEDELSSIEIVRPEKKDKKPRRLFEQVYLPRICTCRPVPVVPENTRTGKAEYLVLVFLLSLGSVISPLFLLSMSSVCLQPARVGKNYFVRDLKDFI